MLGTVLVCLGREHGRLSVGSGSTALIAAWAQLKLHLRSRLAKQLRVCISHVVGFGGRSWPRPAAVAGLSRGSGPVRFCEGFGRAAVAPAPGGRRMAWRRPVPGALSRASDSCSALQ